MWAFALYSHNRFSSAWSIALNVIGGVLTIAVSWLFHLCLQSWYRRRFKRIFGHGREPYILVPARFNFDEQQGKRGFPLVKEGKPGRNFSAEYVASGCEVRAASYLSSAFGKDGHRLSVFEDEKSVRAKLDMDFISFGALSNDKTIDVFENAANDLATFDTNKGFFVSKKTGEPLCARRSDRDYGIILKIHPTQFPERTWIACAGLDETGTSGSAYFLAYKWKELEEHFRGQEQFVAVIEVEEDKDESATLIK
jgi:hypothetical protein